MNMSDCDGQSNANANAKLNRMRMELVGFEQISKNIPITNETRLLHCRSTPRSSTLSCLHFALLDLLASSGAGERAK